MGWLYLYHLKRLTALIFLVYLQPSQYIFFFAFVILVALNINRLQDYQMHLSRPTGIGHEKIKLSILVTFVACPCSIFCPLGSAFYCKYNRPHTHQARISGGQRGRSLPKIINDLKFNDILLQPAPPKNFTATPNLFSSYGPVAQTIYCFFCCRRQGTKALAVGKRVYYYCNLYVINQYLPILFADLI